MSDAQYLDALRDLARHGLNSVRVPWISEKRFTRTLDLAQQSGLNGLVILSAPETAEIVPLAQRLARQRGFELYFYGIDECNRADRLVQQIPLSRWIRDAGGRVTTALLKQTQDRLCNPNDSVYDLADAASGQSFRAQGTTEECVDLPIYHATYIAYAERANGLKVDLSPDEPLHDYCRAVFADPRAKSARLELYYWPSWTQRPNVNRVMSGFFLWASGMDGAFPHQYMALSEHFNDVYDDFDNAGVPERDMMTAYPSASGPIPTTQWEAMREGIDDLRYVATLEHALSQLPEGHELRKLVQTQLRALLADYIEPARFFDPQFSDEYTPAKFNEDRERVIRWIQSVRSRTEQY